MAGPLNLDELVIVIREATDGYTAHYMLFKSRSPTAAVGQGATMMSKAIADPEIPAAVDDIEDYRVSADKTNLKDEIALAIDNHLG